MSSEQAKEYIAQLESAIKMIQKPEVTEEWIDEKADRIADMIVNYNQVVLEDASVGGYRQKESIKMSKLQDFIRKIIEEIHGRKKD